VHDEAAPRSSLQWSARLATLLATLLALGLCVGLPAPRAFAQGRSELRLRGLASAGAVISSDQVALLDLDLPVVDGGLRVGWTPFEVLVVEAQLAGGAFLSSDRSAGALLDLTVGLELGADAGEVRPWLSAHAGFGVTGSLLRPVVHLAIGLDVAVSDELGVGPVLAYGHVFQDDGDRFSDDAQWITLGLSLAFAPSPPAPAPAPAAAAPSRPAPSPPVTPPPTIALEPTETLMEMLDDAAGLAPRELLVPVLFHFDSIDLVECSVASLHSLREHLEAHPELLVLEIEGHADGSGSDAHNDELSLRRAEAIREWLVTRGVAPERLRVSARGEADPAEPNDADAGRAQNRRARFLVVSEAR
jgi:outer membrane protein OmpA-like peptidoglycan-associated protein